MLLYLKKAIPKPRDENGIQIQDGIHNNTKNNSDNTIKPMYKQSIRKKFMICYKCLLNTVFD